MARRRPRALSAFLLLLGTLVGAIAYRRRFARREERVDVYYEDGSMVSLVERSAEAERLLPLARDVLDAARR
jgi:hypothetical protein